MQAMAFGALALGWALASWVYFDATDRGKRYPIIWALVVMFLGWALIPEIIYLAIRNQGRRLEVADHVGIRQYLVTTSFTSMALTVAGASTALADALAWSVSDQVSTNDLRDQLASSLAALIIGAALWWPHWSRMDRKLEGGMPDREFQALYGLRRTQMLTSIFMFGGIAVLTTLWVLGGAFSALFQATYAGASGWLPVLGPALFCAAAVAYHAAYYRNTESSGQAQRFASIPGAEVIEPAPLPAAPLATPQAWTPPYSSYSPYGPPPVPSQAANGPAAFTLPAAGPGPAAASAGGFCGKCGTKSLPGDQFCRACGAGLAPPPAVTAA